MKTIVDIYRSKSKEGFYLYLKNGVAVTTIPEVLQQRFGRAEKSMTMLLTADKKLANAKTEKVLAELESKGFYLQVPPLIGVKKPEDGE
ncbi:MAG: hypothetical protein ACI93R_000945 [Flavobacteriales bacterium]|jgi:uncharacterized protein YcgL (UPF0745 family)